MTDQISDDEVDFVTGHLFNRLGLSRWGLCVEDVSEVAREVVTELATRRAQSAVVGDGAVPHEVALAGFYEAQKADVKAKPLYDQCCAIYKAMRLALNAKQEGK